MLRGRAGGPRPGSTASIDGTRGLPLFTENLLRRPTTGCRCRTCWRDLLDERLTSASDEEAWGIARSLGVADLRCRTILLSRATGLTEGIVTS